MKKKLFALFMSAIMVLALVVPTASAVKIGDVIGHTLRTDIVTKINGYDINSYNINGYTVIVAEDLRNYGFDVVWNGNARTLSITKANTRIVSSRYVAPKVSRAQAGKISGDILHTDIVTYANNMQIQSFNIGGKTCIFIDELASAGYGYTVYDNNLRLLQLHCDSLDWKPAWGTPNLPDNAHLEFVTSNVENYPEIALYYKVVDENGNTIDGLDANSFSVVEYLNVNDYLERDVIEAAKLDGKFGLNVSLVIDKSGSIYNSDMNKIKNVIATFVSKLQFNYGDKAEIIAFDDYVMQMCTFTTNKALLINGVNQIYPEGMTACYDAIIKGINNANAQSGARCVIAFTDGVDNESSNSPSDVINLAKAKGVPVYIIGVGGCDKNTLQNIAVSTGGTYHHIDDVGAIEKVFNEIYREQKGLYMIKYQSGYEFGEKDARSINLNLSSNTHSASSYDSYTPVVPAKKQSNGYRYEVIKADVSWEEASMLCTQRGGHLATITSAAEEKQIIALAEKSGISRLWIGGYTTKGANGAVTGHWETGETWYYNNWYPGEPSRYDKSDSIEEFYLMLWKVNGKWSWNDQRNDLVNSQYSSMYKGKMGYIIEFED